MTIRPLYIIFDSYGAKKKGPQYYVKNHRDEKITRDNIKLKKQSFEKLLSYPITAFGYDLNNSRLPVDINPKFEKHQVIKALDFWIEYWVYENKKDYILTGTVDKDFELTLKELIEVREAVLKEPSTTMFTRKKIKPDVTIGIDPGYNGKDFASTSFIHSTRKDGLLEIGENILPGKYSAIDQFCYKVKTISMEEYTKKQRYTTPGGGFLTTATDNAFSDLERMIRMLGSNVSITSTPQAEWTTIGTAAEPLHAGDLVITDENGTIRRANAPMMGETVNIELTDISHPDHLFISNLHPGIHIASTEQQSIIYEDMMGQFGGDIIHSDPNTFVTVPVRFLGSGDTMINTNIFLESNLILNLDSFSHHRVEIRPDSQNFLQIDGVRFHTVDLNISHDPRQPINGYIFRDLYIQEIETTVDNSGTSMRVDFLQINNSPLVRTNISLTLEINSISYENLIHDIPWELEILGNNRVRITGTRDSIYEVVRAPIQINFFH